MKAVKGDIITVVSHRVGRSRRVGVIVEVVGPNGAPPYRVRWNDGEGVHLFVPGSDAGITPAEG